MWSRRLGVLDVLVIALAVVLTAITQWAASYPVPGTLAFYLLTLGWGLVALV